jgi:hypothetical protein
MKQLPKRLIVTYSAESWTLTKQKERDLVKWKKITEKK